MVNYERGFLPLLAQKFWEFKDIFYLMSKDFQEMIHMLKEVSNDDSWDYERSYDKKYAEFFTKNYNFFSFDEILAL